MVLPNLTPDEGGAASALLPLGGLIVIHDAAGCLENYILFDEPRWFGSDAMLYTSRLSQMEAILGGDEQLVSGITEAAEKMQPEKKAAPRKSQNFLLDDDEFEFEFLNMDDKDL